MFKSDYRFPYSIMSCISPFSPMVCTPPHLSEGEYNGYWQEEKVSVSFSLFVIDHLDIYLIIKIINVFEGFVSSNNGFQDHHLQKHKIHKILV